MANSHLPPEILDCIVDILHDELETLKGCRLVSKSWIPRTRRYLFAGIQFFSVETVESWKENFPDPSNSPAYYTRTLSFRRAEAVTAAGGLTQSFSRVVRLELTPEGGDPLSSFGKLEKTSLIPFHGFSPLKSLYMSSMTLSHPQILSLIRSSPFLEDLSLIGHDLDKDNNPDGLQAAAPWTSPALTGSLELLMTGGIEYITRRLLDLPGGLRFQQLTFPCLYYEDIRWMMELVVRCSDTLERLDIRCRPPYDSSSTSIDLSKAKGLGHVDFWPGLPNVGWITAALQTITPNHQDLRHISIHIWQILTFVSTGENKRIMEEQVLGQWLELDRFLIKFWESHSIRPKVVCMDKGSKEKQVRMRNSMGCLLPEATKRGIVDLV